MNYLNDKLFLDKGYTKFENRTKYRNADYLLQKRVRDEDGNTKYFITIYVYDLSEFGIDKVSYEADSIMWDNPEDSDSSYTIKISVNDIDDMEQRFEKLHKWFGGVLDFHNN